MHLQPFLSHSLEPWGAAQNLMEAGALQLSMQGKKPHLNIMCCYIALLRHVEAQSLSTHMHDMCVIVRG